VRHLSVAEVIELHRRIIVQSGGSEGIRDRPGLLSAIGQPLQTFGGEELYPTVVEKAAALGFFLCRNHAFVDGNKRISQAALEVMLVLNGFELSASIEEQERIMLDLADGKLTREQFTEWVRSHTTERGG
jgi:death on curing protein